MVKILLTRISLFSSGWILLYYCCNWVCKWAGDDGAMCQIINYLPLSADFSHEGWNKLVAMETKIYQKDIKPKVIKIQVYFPDSMV